MDEPQPSFQRKIAVLGARNVGKTTLTVRFVEQHFVESYYPTIENEFTKIIQFKGNTYTLEILDTAGQDEFSLLNAKSLIGVKGIVLCYSVSNRSSFELVPVVWDKLVDQLGRDDLPCIVVANKIDVRDSSGNYVTAQEGRHMAQSIGSSDGKLQAGFVECSAKEDVNVEEAIRILLEKMRYQESGGESSDSKCVVM
ncbi:RHB1 (YCR027C) [Zygosaccharomyces parabailii]|nr:RHB1 (YCR027C) [Zygosaccharomyces parabailii]CDH11604.1 probable Rheb-like protein RHB1 [Zygosaccharomyces bailii ISA1307]SJM87249.1 probable Rheb-like protein RHB1 [Zygosaccharomyces bailii]